MDAAYYLRRHKINPSKLLRLGGEAKIIKTAQEFKNKKTQGHCPF